MTAKSLPAGIDTSAYRIEDRGMEVQIEFETYKSLVMQLVNEDDTFDRVIARLIQKSEETTLEQVTPVNQRDPGFWYRNRWHRSANAIDTYIEFLEVLARDYSGFFELFESRCAGLGNSRPYIAKDRAALYPGSPHLLRYGRQSGEWWIDGNIKNQQKLDLMYLAAEAVGLRYGVDVKFSLPNAG